VWSKLSFKHYARKRVLRGWDSPQNRQIQKSLIQELKVLKRFSHQHLVKVMGSYTDKNCIAYLMEPVADCDLEAYLSRCKDLEDSRFIALRNFYGCLASAIQYLHKSKVRHRDLKPANILIKNDQVYVSDFGTAFDWSSKEHTVPQDRNVPCTVRYMAPELNKGASRGSATDMWSLGVVFLEMTTVLRGKTIADFKKHLTQYSRERPYVWATSEGTHEWFDILQRTGSGPAHDNEPIAWIKDLTQQDPRYRPTAESLMKQIMECSSSRIFCGFCCTEQFGAAEFDFKSICWSGEGDADREKKSNVMESVAAFFEDSAEQIFDPNDQSIEKWLDDMDSDVIVSDESDNQTFIPDADLGYAVLEDHSSQLSHIPSSDGTESADYEDEPVFRVPELGYNVIIEADSDEDVSDGASYRVIGDESGSEGDAETIRCSTPLSQEGESSTSMSGASDSLVPLIQPHISFSNLASATLAELNALLDGERAGWARDDSNLTQAHSEQTQPRQSPCLYPLQIIPEPIFEPEELPSNGPPFRSHFKPELDLAIPEQQISSIQKHSLNLNPQPQENTIPETIALGGSESQNLTEPTAMVLHKSNSRSSSLSLVEFHPSASSQQNLVPQSRPLDQHPAISDNNSTEPITTGGSESEKPLAMAHDEPCPPRHHSPSDLESQGRAGDHADSGLRESSGEQRSTR
jgi:serine/threonine protein kinase